MQANRTDNDVQKSDSINALAQDSSFVTASLLVVEPGNKLYTCYGHAAIRLQNPANQLDFCFTFEMVPGFLEQVKFFFSTAKSGYAAFPTTQFLEQYRQERRGVTEYVLNLNPRQKQELWKKLDEELLRGPVWDYDFLDKNCSSMCIYAIESSLQGEHIVYGKLHPALTGTYTDLLEHISRNAPWAELFWKSRLFGRGGETGDLNDKLAPELLAEAWQNAQIADNAGNVRPVIAETPTELLPWHGRQQPPFFTPLKALLLLIIIVFFICFTSKKCKFMKKITLKKSLLTAALVLLTSEGAFAFSDSYVPLHGQVLAYPTGAGKVYAKMEGDAKAAEGQNFETPADVISVKFVYTTITASGWFNAYAEPAEGWIFAGFAPEEYEDGEPLLPSVVSDNSNPANLKVTSAVYDKNSLFDSEEDALANIPDDPDGVYYALFTHVAPRISEMMAHMGSVSIDKTVNYIGEDVTIEATVDPKWENYNARFSHWVEKSTGKKITQNPYTLTVTQVEEYEAFFSCDELFEVEFPEEGGYVEFYNDCMAYIPTGVSQQNFTQKYVKAADGKAYFEIQPTVTFVDAKTPAFLYGKGTQQFLNNPAETKPSGIGFYGAPLEDWSGDEGVAVADLTQTIEEGSGLSAVEVEVGNVVAYLLDTESNTFKRVEEEMIPANRVFLGIPQQLFDAIEEGFLPDVIYLSLEDAQETNGIDGVETKASVKNGNTYMLDGRQVSAPAQNGVYIYDGKKLIFRKK